MEPNPLAEGILYVGKYVRAGYIMVQEAIFRSLIVPSLRGLNSPAGFTIGRRRGRFETPAVSETVRQDQRSLCLCLKMQEGPVLRNPSLSFARKTRLKIATMQTNHFGFR